MAVRRVRCRSGKSCAPPTSTERLRSSRPKSSRGETFYVKAFIDLDPLRQRKSAFLLFFWRDEKKESLAKKEKNRFFLASGGQGGERRNCIARPALPSLDPPLSPALGAGSLAARR